MSTNYFKKEEFRCRDECGKKDMQPALVKALNVARSLADVPFVIDSGVRCKKHNESKAVGGSPTSSHLKGWAVDIRVPDSHTRNRVIEGLVLAGFDRYGVYPTFIHADMDPDKEPEVTWIGE